MPVHYAITKRKLSILNRLSARQSYCVYLFSKLIEERNVDFRKGYGEFSHVDFSEVRRRTKLPSAYVQQSRDQALWMWRSYHAGQKKWRQQLTHAKGRWREKLLEREPRKPFHIGLRNRVPIRIDVRTGTVEASRGIKLSPYVLRLSTLEKNYRIAVPLNPAEYHLEVLRKGRRVDFQLVKRNGWLYAHICVKYDVPDRPVRAVMGVDLGVRRATATVLLKPNQPLRREDFSILTDGEKKHRLDRLNRRIAEIQQAGKWDALKRLRHRRRHIAEYFDRLDAIKVAQMAAAEQAIVAVGYPKGIKYGNYCGNGERRLRRTLQNSFSYGRRVRCILEECVERGVGAAPILEAWTSKRCHRCRSTNTRRPTQSLFLCVDCGLQYNADWNSAINIGSGFLPEALSRRAREGLAHAGNELAYKPMSPEARKQESISLSWPGLNFRAASNVARI